MRLALPAAALSIALASAASLAFAAETRIPDRALEQAAQLRERALADDTGWKVTESLTTEVGPRLPGSKANAQRFDLIVLRRLGCGQLHSASYLMLVVSIWLWPVVCLSPRGQSRAHFRPFHQRRILRRTGGVVKEGADHPEGWRARCDPLESWPGLP